MKKLIIYTLLLTSLASAFGQTANLLRCDYRYLPDFGGSYYVGVYQSMSGNIYQFRFKSYCPYQVRLDQW